MMTHPMIIHFPIAFLLLGITLDSVNWFFRNPGLRTTALILIGAGAIGAIGAAITGHISERIAENIIGIEATLERHEELGTIGAWFFGIYAAIRIALIRFVEKHRSVTITFGSIGLALLFLLMYIGYLGGELVTKYGAGTKVASHISIIPTAEHDRAD